MVAMGRIIRIACHTIIPTVPLARVPRKHFLMALLAANVIEKQIRKFCAAQITIDDLGRLFISTSGLGNSSRWES